MGATPSSDALGKAIERYIEQYDWEEDKAHCQNTSKAVRRLVEAIVETGSVDEAAARTVYNLCQNDNAFSPAKKKERIDDLDIATDAKTDIKERIDEGTGIVGAGTYSVPVEGYEDAVFDLFATAINSDDRDEIDAAIEDFAALEVEGVQNGILSPILYFLHPTKYPISNDRSRTGMQQIFDYEMSGRLTSYLDEVERFHEVRAEYPFNDDFRHLDSFFIWLDSANIDLTEEETTTSYQFPEDTAVYWVNQHNQSEIEEEYLRAKTDGLWHHNLAKLSPGDVVFHNFDNELVGVSHVTETAETYTLHDEEYYRVDVDLHTFDEPVPVNADLKEELGRDAYRTEKYYPIDKNANLNEAYLAELSPSAAEFLVNRCDATDAMNWETVETNYFWATADPSIWSVDEIADGGEVHYAAFNEKGNKKRLFEAFSTAEPGDRVLFYESTPVKEIVAEGTVIEGLQTDIQSASDTTVTQDSQSEDDGSSAGIQIQFDRRIKGISWEDLNAIPDLEDAVPIANRAQGSLFPLSEDEFETILALEDPVRDGVSQEAIDQLAAKLTTPDIDISIPDGLYFEDADRLRREIEASLRSSKHIIFTGPPGTGKTKLAKAVCESATSYDQVDDYRFTTATSEWTAFDTIGGYVPSTNDGGQELLFEPRLFLKCFRQGQVVNEWLIIDEINRSDIDKAFGQLFSVLSGDSTELPYERDRTVELRSLSESATDEELADVIENPDAFPVTPSWRLLATMNTYDKTSLYEMSYAFMRRFNFVHVGVPPLTTDDDEVRTSLLDPDQPDNYAAAWLSDDETLQPVLQDVYPVVAVLWQRINEQRVIGPSIVYDIIRYLDSYDDAGGTRTDALTSAVISLVYPQLEGMRPDQQKQLIRSLTDQDIETENGTVDLHLRGDILQQKATDFFGISFDDDA